MKGSLRHVGLGAMVLAAVLSLAGAGCWTKSSATPIEGVPVYTSDGKWVAFTSDRTGTDEIYVARLGAAAKRITESDHGDGRPAWSPDGSRIVFSRSSGKDWPDPESSGLFVVNRDGSGLRQLTNGEDFGPCWVADGETIVFGRGLMDPDVYAVNGNGTNERRLVRKAKRQHVRRIERLSRSPATSPSALST